MDEGNNVIIASFQKNSREAICVGVSEYRGKNLIFVRAYAASLDSADLVPTPAGVTLSIEKCQELVSAVKTLGDVMSTDKVVAKITKNSMQEIWIGTNIFKNRPLIFLRTYAVWGGSSEYKPTKKGISINVELYPQLLDCIEKLETEVSKLL
ncbi:MAG: hypothetical protein HS100_07680 [Anaerolineales bacterium]|nr:hypothetical protein [Anaerolineales bacterium]